MSSRASEFDDIIKGVDMIVEFDKEKATERIALSIDASTASNIEVIKRKIEKNIKNLKRHGLRDVSYFKSQIMDANGECYQGGLKDLIPVVIGADKNNTDNLFKIFAELKYLENSNRKQEIQDRIRIRKSLAKNPIQIVFLKEIKIQLETYRDVLGDTIKGLKIKCNSLLEIINKILKEKEEEKIYLEETLDDKVFNNIKDVCNQLKHGERI